MKATMTDPPTPASGWTRGGHHLETGTEVQGGRSYDRSTERRAVQKGEKRLWGSTLCRVQRECALGCRKNRSLSLVYLTGARRRCQMCRWC